MAAMFNAEVSEMEGASIPSSRQWQNTRDREMDIALAMKASGMIIPEMATYDLMLLNNMLVAELYSRGVMLIPVAQREKKPWIIRRLYNAVMKKMRRTPQTPVAEERIETHDQLRERLLSSSSDISDVEAVGRGWLAKIEVEEVQSYGGGLSHIWKFPTNTLPLVLTAFTNHAPTPPFTLPLLERAVEIPNSQKVALERTLDEMKDRVLWLVEEELRKTDERLARDEQRAISFTALEELPRRMAMDDLLGEEREKIEEKRRQTEKMNAMNEAKKMEEEKRMEEEAARLEQIARDLAEKALVKLEKEAEEERRKKEEEEKGQEETGRVSPLPASSQYERTAVATKNLRNQRANEKKIRAWMRKARSAE